MGYKTYLVLLMLMLTACGGDSGFGSSPSSSSSSSASSSSSSGGEAVLSDSEAAFKNTLYPLLRENCSICHNSQGAAQVPLHADASIETAHDHVQIVVDLDNPSASRIVSRLRDDHHMCWSDCETAASTVENAIVDWSEMLAAGTVSEISCDPRFPQDLVLLAELPFVNSIKALLGDWVALGRDAPDPATKLFSQKGVIANTSLINTRLDWAEHVASEFQRRAAQTSDCLSADRNCARNFIASFAHRAFKRPVSSGEIDDLMAVFDQGTSASFVYGIKLAVQAILVSPSFNHRTEYGQLDSEGNFSLTPHELASTLSFLLTDTLPDQELLQAADSGLLSDPSQIEQQVSRLLAMESTKDSVESTLLSAWNFGNIFGKVKDPELFPAFSSLLASQMYEETRLFLRKNLWRGDISKVLSSRSTFINGALADLYELPFPGQDPKQFVEVNLDGDKRAGLLTQASFLTAFSRTDETSVVARGLFVNGPLLCLPEIPPPPESVVAEVEQQLSADSTELERAEFRANTAPCKNCHSQFDAYGLMFEQYDAIGQYRTYDELGNAIHAGVDLSSLAEFSGMVGGPVEFADMLAGRSEFVECVTRHLFAYGTGENGIKRSQCEVTNITDNLNKNSSLADILKAIATSSALSTRVLEVTQ